jgi:hypothetical protein
MPSVAIQPDRDFIPGSSSDPNSRIMYSSIPKKMKSQSNSLPIDEEHAKCRHETLQLLENVKTSMRESMMGVVSGRYGSQSVCWAAVYNLHPTFVQ